MYLIRYIKKGILVGKDFDGDRKIMDYNSRCLVLELNDLKVIFFWIPPE